MGLRQWNFALSHVQSGCDDGWQHEVLDVADRHGGRQAATPMSCSAATRTASAGGREELRIQSPSVGRLDQENEIARYKQAGAGAGAGGDTTDRRRLRMNAIPRYRRRPWIPSSRASTDCSLVAIFAGSATCFRVEVKHQAEDEGDQSEQGAQHDECAHVRTPFKGPQGSARSRDKPNICPEVNRRCAAGQRKFAHSGHPNHRF